MYFFAQCILCAVALQCSDRIISLYSLYDMTHMPLLSDRQNFISDALFGHYIISPWLCFFRGMCVTLRENNSTDEKVVMKTLGLLLYMLFILKTLYS